LARKLLSPCIGSPAWKPRRRREPSRLSVD
jgi:hypothetical protein